MEVFEVEDTANMFWIKTYKTKKLMNKYSINLEDYSPIVRWVNLVSFICMIWVFPINFTSIKKIRNQPEFFYGIKKKNGKLLRRVPPKIYEVILLWKKTKNKCGLLIFPNIITEQWGLYGKYVQKISTYLE